jgi:class 3 adenylate cyclase
MTVCPHCQTNNPDAARYCLNCGRELPLKCSNCQSELAPGALFCMHCGQPVQQRNAADASRLARLKAETPGALAHKMLSESKLAAASRTASLREQRTVTSLLVDVVGSTQLAKLLGTDTWTEVINRAFDMIAPVIYRYEGSLARLLGDSLLAFFGAPVAHEDDPQRAVQAALEIIAAIRPYSQEVRQSHGVDFAMRVCINTGPVVIGPLADDLTYDYRADGGTINLTSRIKFSGQPMNVLITENTYRFISPYFDCQPREAIEVKGMAKPVQVYQVLSARAVQGQARGFSDLASPMVGRDRELATLMLSCEAVQAGLGRAVLILGEPGMGKTRLIQEWRKSVEQRISGEDGKPASRLWLTGRCVSYKQNLAYQLVIDLLRNMIGVTNSCTEQETRAALQDHLQRSFGEQTMDIYPYLGHLLMLKLEGEALQRSQIPDPQALQTQYLLAMQQLLLAEMQHSSVVLVLEDLHWADAASIELFTRLLPLVSQGPILFCLVSRLERESDGWKLVNAAREQVGDSLVGISLQNLSESDSRSLVSNLLAIENLPEKVRKLILHKAEGNPLFMEEVIRMLIERDAIIYKDNAWVAQREISDRDIPDNLQGLLLARIDRLPSEARYTLLVASVVGRNFPVKVLSQVMGGA